MIETLEEMVNYAVPLPLVAVGAAVLVGMCRVYYRWANDGWAAYRSLSAHCAKIEKDANNTQFWLEQAQDEGVALRKKLLASEQDRLVYESGMEWATDEAHRLLTDPAYYRAKTNLAARVNREVTPDVATYSIPDSDDTIPALSFNHLDVKV